MQLNLTQATQNSNFLKLSTSVREAQEAAKANNNQKVEEKVATNPNKLERNAEADSFNSSMDDKVQLGQKAMRGASVLYLAGFCLGLSPMLFLGATAAFLFMNNNEGFKDKLINSISSDLGALHKVTSQLSQAQQNQAANQTQAANQPQTANQTQAVNQAQAPQQAQPNFLSALANLFQPQEAPAETKMTNPINNVQPEQKAEEKKELTPYEKAEQRYAKAQNYQSRAEMNLQKKEEAQKVAESKLELAKAQLDKAQAEYDKANSQVKMQMTDRMMKLQENVATKQSNVNVAREKANVARALLEEAGVKLEKAQRSFEDMQAEQIVEV